MRLSQVCLDLDCSVFAASSCVLAHGFVREHRWPVEWVRRRSRGGSLRVNPIDHVYLNATKAAARLARAFVVAGAVNDQENDLGCSFLNTLP